MENDNNKATKPQDFRMQTSAADDDSLLEAFFAEARAEQLPDDGFTQRVMMSLPVEEAPSVGLAAVSTARLQSRTRRLSHWWTAACVTVAVAVFTIIGGWQALAHVVFDAITTSSNTGQLLRLTVCGAVLTIIASTELMHREHITLKL